MIKIEGLDIVAGTFRILGLNIEIHEGEFHSLLGPTGCGKTSILESIIGLRKTVQGKIRIGEKEVQSLPPEQREISYVPQDLALFPTSTYERTSFMELRQGASTLKTMKNISAS